jgi:hypothetical protein
MTDIAAAGGALLVPYRREDGQPDAGLLGVLLQQVALQTGKLAPAVATGSVANPLVGVLLGVALLEEWLAPPEWHKVGGVRGARLRARRGGGHRSVRAAGANQIIQSDTFDGDRDAAGGARRWVSSSRSSRR